MKTLIGELKKLQTLLGNFNDLCVQQEVLLERFERAQAEGPEGARLAAALGGLITELSRRRRIERKRFARTFAHFVEPVTRQLFTQHFKQPKQRRPE